MKAVHHLDYFRELIAGDVPDPGSPVAPHQRPWRLAKAVGRSVAHCALSQRRALNSGVPGGTTLQMTPSLTSRVLAEPCDCWPTTPASSSAHRAMPGPSIPREQGLRQKRSLAGFAGTALVCRLFFCQLFC